MNEPVPARASAAPRALVILGQPVSHSLSPVFQNAALEAAGLDVDYARCEVAATDLARVLEQCRIDRTAGNVTMPHKEAVFALASRTTGAARRTGAVNTFWWEGEALVGHNTDVDGVKATMAALCPDGVSADIVLLGAGGSAAAVLVAIEETSALQNARVVIVARTVARAEALVKQTGSRATVIGDIALVDWAKVALVVNATPAGMRDDDDAPAPTASFAPHTAVFDLVYRREGTAWVRAARARGLVAEDGLRMLVEQGAAAFVCWFGVAPSRDVMWDALGFAPPRTDAARR